MSGRRRRSPLVRQRPAYRISARALYSYRTIQISETFRYESKIPALWLRVCPLPWACALDIRSSNTVGLRDDVVDVPIP